MRTWVAAIVVVVASLVCWSHQAARAGQDSWVTATAGLNLRECAGYDCDVRAVMPHGAVVWLTGSWSGPWAETCYDGRCGWAHGDWIAVGGVGSSGGGGYSHITGGYYGPEVVDAVYYWAGYYGVSGDWLYSVAMCESGLDPNAVSFRPNISGSYDLGLFQFQESTFYAHGGIDIWDPWDQARVAAWMFSQGLSHHWLCAS